MSHDTETSSPSTNSLYVKAVTGGTYVCLCILVVVFYYLCSRMGLKNMFGTIMATSFDLLFNTVFFIMSVAVLAGAASGLMSEFGIVALINAILSPLMRPLYNLPGAAALGMVTTFLSDNPAIVALAKDRAFIKYFTYRQRALLTNLGTSFGMGLIVATVLLALADTTEMIYAVIIGLSCAGIGSIISVRLMDIFVKRHYGAKGDERITVSGEGADAGEELDPLLYRKIREGSVAQRTLNALLDGGRTGVELGFLIAPGVLVICTVVMLLVFGEPEGGYSGKAYEGVALLPFLAQKIDFILTPLFGFTSPEAVAMPCTAIGAVGAALGMVPGFLEKGLIGPNDIAVFSSMGMCFSGYLSTHVSMLDALDCRELTGKAILSHTVAALCAGAIAHWLFVLVVL